MKRYLVTIISLFFTITMFAKEPPVSLIPSQHDLGKETIRIQNQMDYLVENVTTKLNKQGNHSKHLLKRYLLADQIAITKLLQEGLALPNQLLDQLCNHLEEAYSESGLDQSLINKFKENAQKLVVTHEAKVSSLYMDFEVEDFSMFLSFN
jgi:hypothetical protein